MGRIFDRAWAGRRAAAIAAVLVAGLAASAAPDARAAQANWADGRWYVGLNVPVMFIDDTESTTTGSQVFEQPPAISYRGKSTSEYKTGFKIAGTVGYEFGGGFRVEGELFFARAEVDKVTYSGVTADGAPDPRQGGHPDLRHRRPARRLRERLVRLPDRDRLDPLYRRRVRLHPGRPERPGIRLQRAGGVDRNRAAPGSKTSWRPR